MSTSPIINFFYTLLLALLALSACSASVSAVPVAAPGLASPSAGGASNANAASPLGLLDLASLSSLPAAGGALPAENASSGPGADANANANANASPLSLLGRVVAYRNTGALQSREHRERRDILAQGVGEETFKRAERFQLRMMRRASASFSGSA